MIRVQCLSLVDLTDKSNFNTLNQSLQLRSQIEISAGPKKMQNQDMAIYEFGSDHTGNTDDSTTGTQTVWKLEFEYEQTGVLGEKFEYLLEDLNNIPIVYELEDTAIFKQSTFITHDSKQKNIYFKHI
jgi:hypothetical protein|tara:strand:- start:77 stop:460 length:384 start_codon:yes stop_codon:yes gene_type:complete